MKKLFLLPLAVLACIGCSKTDLTADQNAAGLQQNDAAEQVVEVTFNNLVPSFMTNETTIEYTDLSGQHQIVKPTQMTSRFYAAPNSFVNLNVVVVGQSDELQGSLSTNTGFYRDLSGANPLTGNYTFGTADAQDGRLEITLQVE